MLVDLFSRLTVRLLPLLILLAVLIPALGERPPSSDELWLKFGFGACALPCFDGITPGQTAFTAAEHLLVSHIASMDNHVLPTGSAINFWASSDDYQLSGLVRQDAGTVDEIRLDVPLPLEPLIDQLGTPDCLLNYTTDQPTTVIFWIRRDVSIGAIMDQHDMNSAADVVGLWLRAVQPNDCELRGALPWRGFAPAWEYKR